MSEHTQAHLFEPFYTTKKDGEGSGLGLAMAASIIAEHHGSISILKSNQEGTSMQFTLPLTLPLVKIIPDQITGTTK